MIFRRRGKKFKKPKSVLGDALYRFDEIYTITRKKIIEPLQKNRRINSKKASILAENMTGDLQKILEDISKDHFKTDYRSDKVRYMIIDLAKALKGALSKVEASHYSAENLEEPALSEDIDRLEEKRGQVAKNMEEIESDYQTGPGIKA